MALSWTVSALATCVAIALPFGSSATCPHPTPPMHGNFSTDDALVDGTFPVNSSVTFTCNVGYTFNVNGTADNSTITATCELFGNWSEEATNCRPVYCGPPSVGFSVQINGSGNYTYQDVISFSCPAGFIFLPPGGLNATCSADGNWRMMDKPVCRAIECRSLLDDSDVPFGNISLYNEGVPDPNVPYDHRDHIYQAQVVYGCDPGAVISGVPVRTCQADGTWSGLPPFCQIARQNCSAVSCIGGKTRTSCCRMNGKNIGCCTPGASLVINDRFLGVNAQCSADMADALLPCAGRIAKCLNTPRRRPKQQLDCSPMPTYGCWHNQIAPSANLTEMMLFCSRYEGAEAATCQEDLTLTLTGTVFTRGLCLPASCVDQNSLQQVVDSSYKLYYDNDVKVDGSGYCQVSRMSINCTNGLSATHIPAYRAPCTSAKNCSIPGLSTWTNCCSIDGLPLGCCTPFVQNLITDRFQPLTGQCRSVMKSLFVPCVDALLECLNNDTDVVRYNCPDLHACSASLHTPDNCDMFTGPGSAYCRKTCQGLINCPSDKFCVPESCANEESLKGIAMGDALIACEFWKNGNTASCQWVNVTISCSNDINVTYTYDGSSDVEFCPAPFKPEFGGYSVQSNVPFKFPVGSEVRYFCNSGYRPVRQQGVGYYSMNITCLPSQKWDLYGPDCIAISCGKPLITNGSGIIVVGTNYTYGSTLELKCDKPGYRPDPPTITCQANGTWSEKTNPWCFAVECPDIPRLLYMAPSSKAPVSIPFGKAQVLNFGVNDTHYSPGDWNHLYGATMEFTCESGTTGSQNVSCTALGSWSTNSFICEVPQDPCSVSGSSQCPHPNGHSEATECCAFGGQSTGQACCKPATKQLISNRFVGVKDQCLTDVMTSYQNCATQIYSCVDKADPDCMSQMFAYYSYGCNSGLPPPGLGFLSNWSDPILTQFCSSFESSSLNMLPCFEEQRDALSGEMGQGRGVCVPASCATTKEGLKTLANSTLALTCATQRLSNHYCSSSAIKLTCSNGVSAEATFDTTCGCPKAGRDMSLNTCCETGNITLGCCKKQTAAVITDRFVNVTGQCQSAFRKQFLACGPTMSRCLDNIVETTRPYTCPSSHGCKVDPRQDNCTKLLNDTGAATCSVKCSGIDTCKDDYYCLPAECANEINVKQINQGDAVLGCDFWKLTQGSSAKCNPVSTETICKVPGSPHQIKASFTYIAPGPVPAPKKKKGLSAGAVVGIVFAAVIVLVIASVIAYTFYKRKHTSGGSYQKLETIN